MKKYVLVAFVFFCFVTANAQFSIGGAGSVNLFGVFTSDDADKKFHVENGFRVGVIGEYAFNENMSIASGLLYGRQSFVARYSDELTLPSSIYLPIPSLSVNLTGSADMKANYLTLPLNFKYRYPLGNDWNLTAEAGPYVDCILSGKIDLEGTIDFAGYSINESMSKDADIGYDKNRDLIKRWDFGLGIGLGAEYKSFFVKLSYEHGLVDLSNNVVTVDTNLGTISFDEKYSIYNQYIGLTAGYLFKFKKK